ncbi:MAG: universal stress protein [Sandaracinaceae bacterium]|nr:universal stress protein [Sandaracinaceae bacterium]
MPPFHRALAALDYSHLGDGALEVARALCEALDLPLALAHVYETPWYAYPEIELGAMGGGDPAAIEGWFREKAGRLLEARLAELGPRASGEVIEGTPIHRVLGEHAAAIGADLLVAGTHGRSAPGRFLLGSVAETLLRTAGIPLLVVPEGGEARFRAGAPIVCATDFSAPARDGVRIAAALALALGAPLELVHVERSQPGDPERRESERLLAYEAENLEASHPGLTVGTHLRYGDASSTIVELAEHHGAGLVVIGTRGEKSLARVLVGSVTDRVIRRSSVPVLAIPPGA